MSARSKDPHDVELGQFAGFESNVFIPPRDVSIEEMELPLDPSERRRELRRRAIERGDLPPEAAEEELTPEQEAQRIRQEAEAFLEEARGKVAEAEKQAEKIMAEARAQAEEIVRQAGREAEAVEARAYQAGFEQGEDAGKRLGDQKIETIVRSLRSLTDQFLASRRDMMAQAEEHMVRLAAAVALKIIRRELRQDAAVVLDVVRGAIARVQRSTQLTIHVSPSDFQFIENHLDDFRKLADEDAEIRLEPDPEVARGGCLVHTDTGIIDATLRTMVRAFLDEIDDEIALEGEEPEGPLPAQGGEEAPA